MADATTATNVTPSETVLLRRLRDLLREVVPDDLWDKLFRQARGHAGGKARAAMRASEADDLLTLLATDTPSGDDVAFREGASAALFNDLATFADPPEWIPYLPKPGTYVHPLHSQERMTFTPERARKVVEQFKACVYQDRLPIDAEHETKLSGAFG